MGDLISIMHRHVDHEQRHSWIHRLYPLFLEYKKLDPEIRKELVKRAKEVAGVTPTTLQRSFSAFSFLEKSEVNILSLQEGVTLMGIEAAAKAIAINRSAGEQLLQLVLNRQVTSRQADDHFRYILDKDGEYFEKRSSRSGKLLLRRGGVPAERGALASTSDLSKNRSVVFAAKKSPELSELPGKTIETELIDHTTLKYRDAFNWMAQAVYAARGGRKGTDIERPKQQTELRNEVAGEFHPLAAINDQCIVLSSLFYLDTDVHTSRSSHFEFLSTLALRLLENHQVYVILRSIPPYLQKPIRSLKAAKPSNIFVLENEIRFNTEHED